MIMVAFNVDLSGVTPGIGGAAPVKNPGWYTGVITETSVKPTKETQEKKGTSHYLEIKIAYQDGSTHIERYNIFHDNDEPKRIAKENFAALLLALGLDPRVTLQDTQQIHNLPFEHFLSLEERQGDKAVLRNNRMTAVKSKADGKVYGQTPTEVVKVGPAASAAPAPAARPNGFTPPAGGFTPGPSPAAAPAPVAAPPGMPAATPPAQPWGGGVAPAAPVPGGAFPAAPAQPAQVIPVPPAAPPVAFPGAPAAPAGFPGAPAAAPFPAAAPATPAAPFAAPGGFPTPGGAPWGGPQQ